MDITVKRIPEPVYLAIKEQARSRKRSLNAEILVTLENEAAVIERRKRMKAALKRLDKFVASLPKTPDSTPIIRAARYR